MLYYAMLLCFLMLTAVCMTSVCSVCSNGAGGGARNPQGEARGGPLPGVHPGHREHEHGAAAAGGQVRRPGGAQRGRRGAEAAEDAARREAAEGAVAAEHDPLHGRVERRRGPQQRHAQGVLRPVLRALPQQRHPPRRQGHGQARTPGRRPRVHRAPAAPAHMPQLLHRVPGPRGGGGADPPVRGGGVHGAARPVRGVGVRQDVAHGQGSQPGNARD